MRVALVISTLLHAAILVAAVRGLPSAFRPEPFKNPPMVVDLVKIETEIKTPDPVEEAKKEILAKAKAAAEKLSKSAKKPPTPPKLDQEKKKKAPLPKDDPPLPTPRKVAALPKPAERQRQPEPILKKELERDPAAILPAAKSKRRPRLNPKLVPIPKEKPKPKKIAVVAPKLPKPKEKPKPKKIAAVAPNTSEPRKKPKKKKPDVLSQISQLLDKRAKAGALKSRRTSKDSQARAASSVRAKLGATMSMSEIDAIRRQIEGCWSVPAGARDAKNLIVEIKIFLNKDGSLAKAPKIVDRSRMSRDSFYQVAAESARRAVINCAPLKGLPKKKFEHWRAITLQFNPKDMLGG